MSVSHNFREISYQEAKDRPHSSAWQDPNIPHQQLTLVRGELERWENGQPFVLYDTLKECMQVIENPPHIGFYTVLEIGCGVGHNAKVIDTAGNFYYVGIDYSPHFIDIANEWHKESTFSFMVMDARDLSTFNDKAFDIVVHSACLLHIINWRKALHEAARITSQYLVLHRTPISMKHRNQYFLKDAYGVECLEIWFHEMELFAELNNLGFDLKRVWTTSQDLNCTYHTYLLERK